MPTLYLDDYHVCARLEDRRVVVVRKGSDGAPDITMKVPLFNLERVVCVGQPNLTMPLMQELMKNGIPVAFVSRSGRWLGRLDSVANADAARRLCQYQAATNETLSLRVSKAIVCAKLHNMRRTLQRLAAFRHESACDAQIHSSNFLRDCLRKVDAQQARSSLMGLEGTASAAYFQRLRDFFPPEIPFVTRNRHPPKDPANALLSWTYTIVTTEVENTIREMGLDPCLGFFHEVTLGRASLAADLVEPLRAPLCDMLVLNLLNHRMIGREHFMVAENGDAIYLTHQAKKIFFQHYEEYMERPFHCQEETSRTTYRKVMEGMARTVCRAIAGGDNDDIDFFRMP